MSKEKFDENNYNPFREAKNAQDKAFETLGLSRTASLEEAKQAFRKLISQYHPDKNPGKEKEVLEKAKEIIKAYQKIEDWKGHDTEKTESEFTSNEEQQSADSFTTYERVTPDEQKQESENIKDKKWYEWYQKNSNDNERRWYAWYQKNSDDNWNDFLNKKETKSKTADGENYERIGDTLHYFGDAGDYLARDMREGIIIADGKVGKWPCNNMTGGTVIITGHVREFGDNAFCSANRGTIIYKGVKLWENGRMPKGLDKGPRKIVEEINLGANKKTKKPRYKMIEDKTVENKETNGSAKIDDNTKIKSILEQIKNKFFKKENKIETKPIPKNTKNELLEKQNKTKGIKS